MKETGYAIFGLAAPSYRRGGFFIAQDVSSKFILGGIFYE
jgi:hypothetical protein